MSQDAEVKTVPAGFKHVETDTSTSGWKYRIPILQADGTGLGAESRELAPALLAYFKAYEDAGKDPNEIIPSILNASQAQGAKQSTNAAASEVAEKDEKTRKAKLKEIRESVAGYLRGKSRGGGGRRHETGLTTKQRTAYGTRMAEEMIRNGGQQLTPERHDEILTELGIDPEVFKAEQENG